MAVPISNVTRRQVYAPSGSGGAGPYAFTFEILANTDIAVFKDNTLLTLTTHYTVTINANGTGSVTITAAGLALSPTSPTQYAIVGNRTIARSTDFTTGGDFFANTINDELDQQTIFAQQNAEGLQRSLQAPQTDPTTINMTLPRATDRANKTLAFDASGNPALGISAADVANAVTYATNAANSATAAASSASSASSSASSASGSASTASTQASNASTSATSASNSASSASTSATNAAASASTATTQASNASTSATNAASSASAASTSASNASTSATNAATSASTATTQATNASNSASSASGSATSAANSAAAAASALDSFDDRYLGTKTSDPTLDNDGNALVAGALYFSTTQNVMKVYDGASWIVATSAGATSLLQFKYVATAGQTTFSGTATVGGTLTYTVNNIVVFLNGVALDSTDYTASTGTSVVLGTAAALNDELVIIAFKSFTVADTYTKGEADGLLAAKAPLASPVLTGNPTAPTPSAGDNDTSIATTAFVSALTGTSGITGFKNRIINGGMVIDQRNAGASTTPTANGTYNLDRWRASLSQASKFSIQQSSTVPSGFTKSIICTSLSAYTVGASENFNIQQCIEGFNIADLGWGSAGASTVTLSFWVRSSLTGTFGGSLRNNDYNRSYPFSYTISSANTWEQKTVTIAGDTTGTWNTDSNGGLWATFSLGAGSSVSGTSGAWAATNYASATGATSVVGTNGATFYITGVQLEKGSTATSFDYRPYGTELALCQRYCPVFIANPAGGYQPFGVGQSASATAALITLVFPVSVRTPPTGITISAGSDFCCWLPSTAATAATGMSFNTATYLAGVVQPTGMSGLTQGYATTLLSNNTASSKIIFNGCEL
jgi:hypothetical protein